jgi:hypothetical protein
VCSDAEQLPHALRPGAPSGIVAAPVAVGSAFFFPAGFFFVPFAAFTFAAGTAVFLAVPVAANRPGSVFWNRLSAPLVVSSLSIAA